MVAILTGKPGCGGRIIESFRQVSPLVHEEQGCELYAAHLEQGGDTVVMIERWSTRADLDAHASGAPLAELNRLNEGLLVSPYDVWFLDPVSLGDERKGVLQH
ncbi:putative quinol monooxygenase [Rathayibacter sp. PhB185]|uniref:putative quinol monooxygenase n=1 Tax=Rathayibacter sp. PhB185 TaxID=2485198 RepID=UPI00161C7D40|nr:antibiotic biosynthesis monooxygenase family protein [Rathayibacter sp. PhB185]